MELDLTGIHQLAAGQGIDTETVDAALAEALRMAYLKTPKAAKHARVQLDDRAGTFMVWARDEVPVEPTPDNPHPYPELGEEYDDTPTASDAWRPRPRVRSSASCSAMPRTTAFSARSRASVANSSPASFSRMRTILPTSMSRWAMSRPFCPVVSRCRASGIVMVSGCASTL